MSLGGREVGGGEEARGRTLHFGGGIEPPPSGATFRLGSPPSRLSRAAQRQRSPLSPTAALCRCGREEWPGV